MKKEGRLITMLYAYGYRHGLGFMFDPTYILVIIAAVLSMAASAKVQSTFSKYARVRSRCRMTGAEVAKRLLNSQGIYDVKVGKVSGNLTDHYNPAKKILNLSDSTYDSTSVAAIGVAAHECGHAIQHAKGYAPLSFRTAFVPVANFGSKAAIPIILLGLLFGYNHTMVTIGILCFSLAVLFQLITLPVEFNASSRAVNLLDTLGILEGEEVDQTKKVLGAAALTYVAGATGALLQLLRLIILFGDRRDD